MMYLGWDDLESLDEAISCGGVTMKHNGQCVYMDVDGWGYRVYEYDVDRPYLDNHYETLQELIDNYIFPCGTPMKDIVYGVTPQNPE